MWIGEIEHNYSYQHDHVIEIECNLDDVTGETLGYTMERLFAAGALDVWFTPIQMKKSRPGVLLSLLAPVDKVEDFSLILMRETSTLGVRRTGESNAWCGLKLALTYSSHSARACSKSSSVKPARVP